MNEDATVLMPSLQGKKGIQVRYKAANSATVTDQIITKTTVIGRQNDCHIQINDDGVSRHHAELYPTLQGWLIRDLGSANGTLLNGQLIKNDEAILGENEIQLGHTGPKLWIKPILETQATIIPAKTTETSEAIHDTSKLYQLTTKDNNLKKQSSENLSTKEIHQRYFSEQENDNMGDNTRMVRKIIRQEQIKQSHQYRKIISIFSLLLLVVSSLVIYQQNRLQHAQKLAVDIFYDMKTIEVQIARHESQQQQFGHLSQVFNVSKKREQLTSMERRYQQYLTNMKSVSLFNQRPSYQVKIIHRVAQIFGETELMAPKGFVEEVNNYIELWKARKRLPRAIDRLKRLRLKPLVVNALKKQNLPPQFLYLSLQESNFNNNSVGPETPYGYAKGIWQFIPSTATEYGLKIGPLSTTNQYDAEDERFDFKKATNAAAHYLKDIYSKEAQASGLLVMASYNWGHNRVRKLIQKMPDNPRDRNFWQLIQKHKIPKETYDYVFYIFSAAVIGEDPKYFGFDFENPLND